MGGNLFPTKTRRYLTSELNSITQTIRDELSELGIQSFTIPFLSNKKDHGDLDLIVVKESLTNKALKTLAEKYDYRWNGKNRPIDNFDDTLDIFSFCYDQLQVDLITIPEESVDFSVCYHAFNDLGGIIGSCLRHYGYRLSREGLYFNYEPIPSFGNHKIYLTNDYTEFCNVFDLDYTIYDSGNLESVEEMYNYLKDWKYFNSKYMEPNEMNATRRNRAAKRKVFQSIAALANFDGGVNNHSVEDNDLSHLRDMFDKEYIESQMREAETLSSNKKKVKYALSKDRMEAVLGYLPENFHQLFTAFGRRYDNSSSARDAAHNMTDSEFKNVILELIEEKERK